MENCLYKFDQESHLTAKFGSDSVLCYYLRYSLVDLDAKLAQMLLLPHILVCSKVPLVAL
jgi:hypothetical protein